MEVTGRFAPELGAMLVPVDGLTLWGDENPNTGYLPEIVMVSSGGVVGVTCHGCGFRMEFGWPESVRHQRFQEFSERHRCADPYDQPLPTIREGVGSIQDQVIADLESRKAIGLERYGTLLQPHNGRDMLRDAYEEALDLAVYLRGAIEERDTMEPPDDEGMEMDL